MTEEELSLRLKSAFPAAPPAGGALHARVEGKARNARRGIGRKRKGRAIFATLGAACVLTPVALRIPVMIVVYRNFHQTSPKTTYIEEYSSPSEKPYKKIWYSGNQMRVEGWKQSGGAFNVGKNWEIGIRKGGNWFRWREGGRKLETYTEVVATSASIGTWWSRSWEVPLARLGPDRVIDNRVCRTLVQEYKLGQPRGNPIQPLIDGIRAVGVYDQATGRMTLWENWQHDARNGWTRQSYIRYWHDIPVSSSLFEVPKDRKFVSVTPSRQPIDPHYPNLSLVIADWMQQLPFWR